jgi:hypothetical protein
MAEGKKTWVDVLHVVAMPLVTLIVGFLLNSSLSTSQTQDSNLRLYADMMGRREEADSSLRKDMFASILDTFVARTPGQPNADAEAQVLNLELLAYNFHESLDLGPLFKHVQRQLAAPRTGPASSAAATPQAPDANGTSRNGLLWRLERVAEEVKERQLAAISDSGTVERGELDINRMGSDAWSLGKTTVRLKPGEMRGGATLCMPLTVSTADGVGVNYRQFRIEFLDFAPDRRELELSLSVSKLLPKESCERILEAAVERENIETQAQFWVGPFGFPMIDNTRLSHSERCSVSVIRIQDDTATVALSYFPASRASLKDKPYYDEVLQDLLRRPSSAIIP